MVHPLSPIFTSALCDRAYRECTWAEGGVEALLAEHDNGFCVAFRGTQPTSLIDIIRDIRGLPWYDRELGWCHSGFLKGIKGGVFQKGIWQQSAFRQFMLRRDAPIHLTGHSKGGAEACILAAMMVLRGVFPASLTLFGAARAQYGGRLTRILENAGVPVAHYVNGSDPVPGRPMTGRDIAPRRHVGRREGIVPVLKDHRIAHYRVHVPRTFG